MKDYYLKNIKNVSAINDIYKPEGQVKKNVNDLIFYCKKGDYTHLQQSMRIGYPGSTLNLALRNLIQFFNLKKGDYLKCIDLLLDSNIDMNYKFPKENGSTLLMTLAKKIDLTILKKILEHSPFINNNIFTNLKKKNKYNEENEELSYYENILFQQDLNGSTFLHYLCYNNEGIFIYNTIDYLYNKFPYFHNNKEEKANKFKELIKNLLNIKDNEGNNFMNLCIKNGLINCVLQIINITGYISNINNQKNNYVHCAVLSKNITCLKIILYHCNKEDLNCKNIDSYTPSQLANKLGNKVMNNIINEYLKYFNEADYKTHFNVNLKILEKKAKKYENCSIDLLESFSENNFKPIYYELKELKLIQNIILDSNGNIGGNGGEDKEEYYLKISILKIDWNIILTQMKIYQIDYASKNNTNNNSNNRVKQTNKKKLQKNGEKINNINNHNNFFSLLYKNSINYFENVFADEIISTHISYINTPKKHDSSQKNKELEINNNFNKNLIDILIYNKIIFYFKFGYTKSLLKTAAKYLTEIFDNNSSSNINYSWILYVNISFILIEIFIYHGYKNVAEKITESLNRFLFTTNCNFSSDISYSLDEDIINNYLIKNEVFNQFSTTWDEAFCYCNLLKVLFYKEKDKSNEYLNHYKKLINACKYVRELPIFTRIKLLNICIEIKKLYEKEDNTNNIYTKLRELKSQGDYAEIYSLNSSGIIFLKKKKYRIAKLLFYKALNKYIDFLKYKYIISHNNIYNNTWQNEKFFNFRIDYITSIKYNISLCHFYLKEYRKCIGILKELLLYKSNQNNFFFYYRLGICYLEIYLNQNKKNFEDFFNKNILSLFGYDKKLKSNNKKNKNEKSLSIDFDNDSMENLSYQFEEEYREKNKYIDNYRYDTLGNRKLNLTNNTNTKDYSINKPIKRIVLLNTTKFFKNITNNKSIKNLNNKNTNLENAIINFKKAIKVSKYNFFSDEINSLRDFYSKDNESIENTNISEIEENKINYYPERMKNELLINLYLNLLFCLSLKKLWGEMILIIKDYNCRKFNSNKTDKAKILLYKLEAYSNLDNIQKSKEVLNKLKVHKKIELAMFNQKNSDIIIGINIKLYLYYLMISVNLRDKNEKEIDSNVNKLFNIIKNMNNIPYYIIDLLINVYLYKLNNNETYTNNFNINYNNIILNLIKNNKIDLNSKK